MVDGRYAHIADRMEGDCLPGDRFTVANAFLYVMLRWSKGGGIEVSPLFDAYVGRVESRSAVRSVLAAEGIKKLSD